MPCHAVMLAYIHAMLAIAACLLLSNHMPPYVVAISVGWLLAMLCLSLPLAFRPFKVAIHTYIHTYCYCHGWLLVGFAAAAAVHIHGYSSGCCCCHCWLTTYMLRCPYIHVPLAMLRLHIKAGFSCHICHGILCYIHAILPYCPHIIYAANHCPYVAILLSICPYILLFLLHMSICLLSHILFVIYIYYILAILYIYTYIYVHMLLLHMFLHILHIYVCY